MTRWGWLWLVVMLLVAGCSGGAKSVPANDPSHVSVSGPPAPAEKSGAGFFTSREAPESVSAAQPAPPPPSPSPGGAADSRSSSSSRPATAEPPHDRPGLGTEWGETRTSRVHDVTFTRADADRPFAMAQLLYNDRRGVEAQANFHARSVERRRDFTTAGGAISVAIHDGAGDPLEAVRMGERTYVVGQQGERYSITITNHTGHRFEAVATVDGLDVINGKTGSLQNRGYVLMPFATLEIDGFRQSNSAVAAFRFAAVGESYAAQMGTARNVGVIGVAFFAERGDSFTTSWTDSELNRRETANPFPGSDPRFARPPR